MLERLENRFVFHKVYTGGGGGEKILGKNIPTQVCTYIISVSTYYVGSKDAGMYHRNINNFGHRIPSFIDYRAV